MRKKTKEEFQVFLSQLEDTNATLDYFVDFEKVRNNVNKIYSKLTKLNKLFEKKDLKKAIEEIYLEDKSVFNILNILIAVRKKETKVAYKGKYKELREFFSTPDDIYEFIKLTKLEEIFKNEEIKNLVGYVYGVEVGLDTNARKNRSGKNMAGIIEKMFKQNEIKYDKEVSSENYKELLSLGEDIKVFDFVVEIEKTYLIEVNFYATSGSKLNEVARSYTDIAPKINKNENFEFVWITDGVGWNDAKNKLEEAYYNIPSIYNLKTIQEFIDKLKEEKKNRVKKVLENNAPESVGIYENSEVEKISKNSDIFEYYARWLYSETERKSDEIYLVEIFNSTYDGVGVYIESTEGEEYTIYDIESDEEELTEEDVSDPSEYFD